MKKIHYALFLGTAVFFAGCQNTVNTTENAEKNMTPTVIADKRFVTDGALEDRLKLTNVIVSTAPSGHMQVQVTATNVRTGVFAQLWSGMTGENPYDVDYKFTWFDENGMEASSTLSNWRVKTIYPGETVYFQAVAPLANCRDFRLDLKESNQ